jgi:hypothetical protein
MEHMSRYYAGKGESHAEHVKQLVTWQLFGVPLLALAVAGLIVSVATTKRRRLLILLTVYALLFLSFY